MIQRVFAYVFCSEYLFHDVWIRVIMAMGLNLYIVSIYYHIL
jgi:hypothetical protein